MTTYKLTSFNARCCGETARVLFASARIQFEDVRIDIADSPNHYNPMTAQGKLPMLTVDRELLHQSSAINQYLAAKFDFIGGSVWEAGLITETVEVGSDLFRPFIEAEFTQSETRKAELTKSIVEVILPKTLQHLEARLQANGSNGFLVGSKLSLADIYTFTLLEPLVLNYPQRTDATDAVIKAHGAIRDHVMRIRGLPGIKDYIDSRKATPF